MGPITTLNKSPLKASALASGLEGQGIVMLSEAYRKALADKSRARNVKYKQQHHTQTQYFKVSWQEFEHPTLLCWW